MSGCGDGLRRSTRTKRTPPGQTTGGQITIPEESNNPDETNKKDEAANEIIKEIVTIRSASNKSYSSKASTVKKQLLEMQMKD